jgi:hypothetical protein
METVTSTKTELLEKMPNPQLPVMEVNVGGALQKAPEKELVSDDQMIGVYNEILDMIRDDRKEVDDILGNFVNMVLNEGDASTSSKEALVNILKIKTDLTNNMSRIFDLMARLKMKDKSIPGYIAAHQHNEIKIGGTPKRKLLETLAKEAKKKE